MHLNLKNKNAVVDFTSKIEECQYRNVKLYMVLRDVNKTIEGKTISYQLLKIALNEELQAYFKTTISQQLNNFSQDGSIEIQEYNPITDDIKRIYTYKSREISSFSNGILDKFEDGVNIPEVQSLDEIKNKLWAYCISINFSKNDNILCFKKISSSKVYTDELSFKEKMLCWFDKNSSRLEKIDKEIINFDRNIDFVFYNGIYYIFQKSLFESTVGIEDEILEIADQVVEELENSKLFDGLDLLKEKLNTNSNLRKRIAAITKTSDYKQLDKTRIKKMKEVCDNLHLNLKFNKGKIVIEDYNDVDLVVKLLNRYYVACMQTSTPYGAYAKDEIKIA
ncbi:MAG: DUF4868 domain-containing protein [Ignavibacteriae bacterium]|nr:MAG: DUF4868 domain-containing protein [Ignavibacteriota bacterium]